MGQREACNPFDAMGRLVVDEKEPTGTMWKPYEPDCEPSRLMASLYHPAGTTPPFISPGTMEEGPDGEKLKVGAPGQSMEWFRNRTVVLHGDSIDRFHLIDFCELVGGSLFLVTPSHPASPKSYHLPHIPEMGPDGKETAASRETETKRMKLEASWEGRSQEAMGLTRPWVCDIEEYGTTLVNVFTWGLEGAEELYKDERWYYGPATSTARLEHITVPLLKNLAVFLNRPQIVRPDLIEINTGFWDLRRYTEEDFIAVGASRPYPEDSPIPFSNLTPEREQAWEIQARELVEQVAMAFPGTNGKTRDGPIMLWRTLHHPLRHNYTPFSRVFALDSLAKKVVKDLQSESFYDRSNSLGLNSRLRFNDWGRLMLGQEHTFRDLLHPKAVPGSYVWGDVLLFELKRAVSLQD